MILQKWKRFMAVGCTHGHLVDPKARALALGFAARWKPHLRIDLGDVIDTAAFRGGAKGTKDECEPTGPDKFAARDWLTEYEPNVITWGNHDWRVWELAEHPNAIISTAAVSIRDELTGIARKLKAETRDYNIRTGWYRLGDTLFGHGYMYSQNATLEHARKFGKCVIAHLHRPEQVPSDRHDGAVATCVGFLGDAAKFGYAHRRPAFFRWAHGLAFGEYCDKKAVVWLTHADEEGEWRMPI